MNRRSLASVLFASLLMVGCGGKGAQDKEPVMIPPPKPPVAPPAKTNRPIDQDLRRDAVGELTKAFSSNSPVLRANAIEATQRTLGLADAEKILKGLDDPSPLVRFASAMAAGGLQLSDAKAKLLTNLRTPEQVQADPDRVSAASEQVGVRYALHRLGIKRYSHDLETFAVDRNSRVRANVVMVLGLLGEKSAVKILNAMTNDPDPAVQLQAVEAKYKLGDESALEDLAIASVSKYPDDQIISLLALGASGDARNARLISGKLTSDYTEVTLAAARALGMLGNDLGMGVALQAADSRDARQRGMAALAMGAIGRTDAQPELGKLLRDKDPNVRLAAAQAILQLKPD